MKKIAIALIALVLVAGCIGGEKKTTTTTAPPPTTTTAPPPTTSAPVVKTFDLMVKHTSYDPAEFKVNLGNTVKFNMIADVGTLGHKHGIAIDEFNVSVAAKSEEKSNPTVVQFVANKKGEFKIYCKTCKDGLFGSNHPAIEAKLIVE